jgi:inward rectifier potassium channel
MERFRMIRKDGKLNVESISRGVRFSDLYHDLIALSWPRFTIWFGMVFFAINCIFGFIYFNIPAEQFDGLRHASGMDRFLDSFFFSVQTLGTIGYGHVSPIGTFANFVVTLECYTGLFVVALMTGLIFTRFSKPHVKVVFSQNAVIKKFGDLPCLMFRIANERQNHITDASVKVHLVMDDPDTGYREFKEIVLERSESPLFALSWTIAHDLDSNSPVARVGLSELKKRSAELIVSFRGMDANLSQEIHAKSSYTVDEILPDHDFVDVIERTPSGAARLKMEDFHKVRAVSSVIA